MSDNVIQLRIKRSKKSVPGQKGRPGRIAPELGDAKTKDAINRIRLFGQQSIANLGDEPMPELPPQEEDFCQFVSNGYSLAEAWRRAFDGEDHPAADSRGKALSRRPRIAMRINMLFEERRNDIIDEGQRLRVMIAARLEHEVLTAKEGASRLKAMEMLGKMPHVAAFEERTRTVSETSSSGEIEKALLEKLRSLG